MNSRESERSNVFSGGLFVSLALILHTSAYLCPLILPSYASSGLGYVICLAKGMVANFVQAEVFIGTRIVQLSLLDLRCHHDSMPGLHYWRVVRDT